MIYILANNLSHAEFFSRRLYRELQYIAPGAQNPRMVSDAERLRGTSERDTIFVLEGWSFNKRPAQIERLKQELTYARPMIVYVSDNITREELDRKVLRQYEIFTNKLRSTGINRVPELPSRLRQAMVMGAPIAARGYGRTPNLQQGFIAGVDTAEQDEEPRRGTVQVFGTGGDINESSQHTNGETVARYFSIARNTDVRLMERMMQGHFYHSDVREGEHDYITAFGVQIRPEFRPIISDRETQP